MRRSVTRGKTIGGCTVTSTHLIAPRKTFKLDDVSRVDLRRTLFMFVLPVLLGMLSLVWANSELIYTHEKFWAILAFMIVGGGSFSIGFIHLTGFNLGGGMAVFGSYSEMSELKDVLAQRTGGSSRPRGRR